MEPESENGATGYAVRKTKIPNKLMVGATGFEPATSWSQTKCSSQAELRSVDRCQYSSFLQSMQSVSRGKFGVEGQGRFIWEDQNE